MTKNTSELFPNLKVHMQVVHSTAPDFKPKRIIFVPVDASEQSPKVIQYMKQSIAAETDLVIIFTCYKNAASELGFQLRDQSETIAKLEHQFVQNAKELVTNYCSDLNRQLIRAKGVIQCGDPKKLILEQAKEHRADIIVMGRRGLGVIGKIFMGSVSTHILNNSEIPVLIIP
jgi:nucleotide-binding universal stress UspA family protein